MRLSYLTAAELLESIILRTAEGEKNLRGWVTLEAWEIDGVRYEISYTYDDAGNRTSMTYPDGTTVRTSGEMCPMMARRSCRKVRSIRGEKVYP